MSGATTPTGGSNRINVSRTTEDLNKMFGFELLQMDFEVDKNRSKDEKEGESGNGSGSDSDTTTPIIPGNHKSISGIAYAKVLQNPELIISKPVQDRKGKDNKKEVKESEAEKE